MKKTFLIVSGTAILALFAFSAGAQMMMGGLRASDVNWAEVVEHTAREEAEGKELWNKFQAKELTCKDLGDEQFEVLGEYFMGAMMGDSHSAMNAMMMQMHGEEGEEQIHGIMGKRLLGCDTSAAVTGVTGGWMSTMNMMNDGWSSTYGGNRMNKMLVFGHGSSFFGLTVAILLWILLVIVIIALVKWISNQTRAHCCSDKENCKQC